MEVAIFFVPLSFLIGAMIMYDKLLKIEYQEYRNEWESDKVPYGFFWRPKGAKFSVLGSLERNCQYAAHLVRSSDWIKKKGAKKYLFLCRLFILTSFISLIVLVECSFAK